MKLLLVESPTKSKTLKKFLGKDYQIAATMGHIRDLPKNKLGVDIEHNFEPQYVIPPQARKRASLLKKLAKNQKELILATDPDREGEAIAWHLTQVLKLGKFQIPNRRPPANSKTYQRIVFHEITKSAIKEALRHPRGIDMNLVNAQQVRRILDRLVGYKLSPLLWKKIAWGLSAGRVQSVALRLVVEREKEIEEFKPQEYWSIEAELRKIPNSKLQTKFKALLVQRNGKQISKLGIKTKKQADKIVKDLKGGQYKVSKVEKKEIQKNPLPPFLTSTLQQEAGQRFGWPAKFTMQVAQNLYERGYITYHRTDSLNLSQVALNTAKKFIIENYGPNYWPGYFRRYKTQSKGAQEAHEAIRPTYPSRAPEDLKTRLDKNYLRLYDLIWRRFIACQMTSARFDSTTVEVEAQNPKSRILNKYTFRATGQILKFDGFLKIYPIQYKEKELPPLEKDEFLKLLKLLPSQHFTQPPPRYTEATLIRALEKNGIGRPSTYAPIVSTIQMRRYVEKEKARLQPTDLGRAVNELLTKHFPDIVDVSFTAHMEQDLDQIAQGHKDWLPLLKKFYEPFAKKLSQKEKEIDKKSLTEKETQEKCPQCGKPLVEKLGRFGKFYSCSSFPQCRYRKPILKEIGVSCPKCQKGQIVERKSRKGKIFYGCSQYPRCDFALWNRPTGEKCPECGNLLVESGQTIKCSNKSCKFQKTKSR